MNEMEPNKQDKMNDQSQKSTLLSKQQPLKESCSFADGCDLNIFNINIPKILSTVLAIYYDGTKQKVEKFKQQQNCMLQQQHLAQLINIIRRQCIKFIDQTGLNTVQKNEYVKIGNIGMLTKMKQQVKNNLLEELSSLQVQSQQQLLKQPFELYSKLLQRKSSEQQEPNTNTSVDTLIQREVGEIWIRICDIYAWVHSYACVRDGQLSEQQLQTVLRILLEFAPVLKQNKTLSEVGKQVHNSNFMIIFKIKSSHPQFQWSIQFLGKWVNLKKSLDTSSLKNKVYQLIKHYQHNQRQQKQEKGQIEKPAIAQNKVENRNLSEFQFQQCKQKPDANIESIIIQKQHSKQQTDQKYANIYLTQPKTSIKQKKKTKEKIRTRQPKQDVSSQYSGQKQESLQNCGQIQHNEFQQQLLSKQTTPKQRRGIIKKYNVKKKQKRKYTKNKSQKLSEKSVQKQNNQLTHQQQDQKIESQQKSSSKKNGRNNSMKENMAKNKKMIKINRIYSFMRNYLKLSIEKELPRKKSIAKSKQKDIGIKNSQDKEGPEAAKELNKYLQIFMKKFIKSLIKQARIANSRYDSLKFGDQFRYYSINNENIANGEGLIKRNSYAWQQIDNFFSKNRLNIDQMKVHKLKYPNKLQQYFQLRHNENIFQMNLLKQIKQKYEGDQSVKKNRKIKIWNTPAAKYLFQGQGTESQKTYDIEKHVQQQPIRSKRLKITDNHVRQTIRSSQYCWMFAYEACFFRI